MLHRSLSLTCVCALAVFLEGGSPGAQEASRKPPRPAAAKKKAPDRKPAPDRLRPGAPAPDFELKSLDGKQSVKLSAFRGQKPVALIFGSYT